MNQILTSPTARLRTRLAACLFVAAAASVTTVQAATIVWSGATGTNWSAAGNWTGGLPAVGDDVMFNDPGTNALNIINNLVAASTTIGSLSYGNSNNSHATLIAAGQTLTVNSNLHAFTSNNLAAARNLTNVISGATLTINNSSAVVAVNQANTVGSPSRQTLNLSGLDTFNVTARAIGLGSTFFPNSGASIQRCGGMLVLAKTNNISLSLTDTLANYQTLTSRTNAIELSRNPGNNPGITCILLLGQTNTIALDSINCGMDKSGNNSTASSGLVAFNPAVTNNNPGAVFRGVGGGSARIKWWSIGDGNASASSSNGGRGTNDFANGTVDMLIDVLSLGRECNAANTGWPGPHSGHLTFNRGVIDVNTVYAGNQPFTQPTSAAGTFGVINVSGSSATLKVNTALNLGYTTGTSVTAVKSTGILNLQGGTALVNQVNVGAASVTNVITMTNATLILSNTIASPAKGLLTYATTNSTLQLNVTGVTNVVVTNLVVGGATNILFPANVAVFASYPKQITLIKYVSLTGTYNFGFGANVLPASAPGAYLSNNVANSSVDLVLPTDPRPSGTAPSSYSGSPGDNVTFAVTPSGATPLTYQWRKAAGNIADGATGTGATYVGTATASLGVTNAQPGDNGNYDLIIANAYGSFTSAVAVLTISAGNVAPSITGPNNTTVIQGNNATLTATVSGVPAPALQWQKTGVDISNATNSSLTINNAQYPADQATYSIIATNIAGAATNSAVLTVIVTPAITVQPVSLTVTNTQAASFSVTATGVPTPTYQWKKNGSTITEATNATLNFASAAPSDIAGYTVVVLNAAGSVTSSNATLSVNSTMTISSLSPANNATGLCFDTPLSISFSSSPVLRTPGTGKIRIYNTVSNTPVDTLDMALNTSPHPTYAANIQSRVIGTISVPGYPVIITGNTAAIYPRPGVMTSNQTYYVIVDNGVFTDAAGAWQVGVTGTNDWRFTTKTTVSATATTNPIVNADGSGDFATIQGALDYLPASGPTRRLIEIRNGNYTELVVIAKSNVTLRGQSRLGAKQQYYNNANLNGSTRARMSLHVKAPDVAFESMTLTNMTPQGGGQAEALFLESGSTAAKRFVMLNCLVTSYQDTILGNDSDTPAYFANSTIQGQTDYIWGGATMFFTNCELKMLANGGQYANPSSSAGSNGFAFVGCTLTRAAPVTTCFLGRTRSITNGNTAFINCPADSHVSGWQSDALPTNSYRLWHYGVSNLTATVNRDASITNSILLTAGDPRLTLALDSTAWLYGWVPQLAPNILTNPVGQYLAPGGTITLTVAATGVPEPTYQWQKNGTNVPGATSATLSIPGAVVADSGNFTVIVSNVAGTVTSSSATVTVNTDPVAASVTATTTVNTPLLLAAAKVLLYCSDPDGNPLTLSSVSASSTNGGTATLSLGTITYTPVTSFIGVDQFNYTITDGIGGAATSTVTVTVTASGTGFNQLNVQVLGPDVVLTYLGIPALNYALDRSFNLTPPVTWTPQITNPAAGNGYITFTNTPDPSTNNFWRTRYVP